MSETIAGRALSVLAAFLEHMQETRYVQREFEAFHALKRCIRDDATALAAARAEVERLTMQYDNMKAYADMRDADLAAVRKVEEWIQRGNDPLKPEHAIAGVVNRRYGAFVRCEAEETTVATGKSLIALGRALAAQEGTDAT